MNPGIAPIAPRLAPAIVKQKISAFGCEPIARNKHCMSGWHARWIEIGHDSAQSIVFWEKSVAIKRSLADLYRHPNILALRKCPHQRSLVHFDAGGLGKASHRQRIGPLKLFSIDGLLTLARRLTANAYAFGFAPRQAILFGGPSASLFSVFLRIRPNLLRRQWAISIVFHSEIHPRFVITRPEMYGGHGPRLSSSPGEGMIDGACEGKGRASAYRALIPHRSFCSVGPMIDGRRKLGGPGMRWT